MYEYLQPAASNLILENKKFAKAYFENLKKLDEFVKQNHESRLGERLYFLLKDFVEQLTDWKLEAQSEYSASEIYKRTWAICRNFVLPINPQRTELDFAVRKLLQDAGIQVKTKRAKRTRRLHIQQEVSEQEN